ncbi:MAG: hypothetical protein DRI92_01615, partial [Aquificota bacterium]
MQVNSRFLFVCTIGPVQSFIAAARTTRDLAFGSWLLSELAKAAARRLCAVDAELVFPTPWRTDEDLKPGSDFNVGNKVMALAKGKPEVIAEGVEGAVRGRLAELYASVEEFLRDRGAMEAILQRAREQVEDLLEFYWSAAVYDGNNYAVARNLTENALSLRKNTRDFAPWMGMEGVPKSALDGFREAVVVVVGAQTHGLHRVRRYEDEGKVLVINEDPPKLREGEALSGVDIFKRVGGYRVLPFAGNVPSTSDMASKPFEEGLGRDKAD